jgi:hypothetical protein
VTRKLALTPRIRDNVSKTNAEETRFLSRLIQAAFGGAAVAICSSALLTTKMSL